MTPRFPTALVALVIGLVMGVIGGAWALDALRGTDAVKIEPIVVTPIAPETPGPKTEKDDSRLPQSILRLRRAFTEPRKMTEVVDISAIPRQIARACSVVVR